ILLPLKIWLGCGFDGPSNVKDVLLFDSLKFLRSFIIFFLLKISCFTLCRLFEVYGREDYIKLTTKDLAPLQGVGPQKCLAFSVDGTRFATGGVDGYLRIFEWPSMKVILDEPRAHKSFVDMDFSLDSEFLATTSTDGAARIWNTNDGAPITTLTRNSDEKIELCRFSKDGTKPFLFCTVQRGNKSLTGVWDISSWKKIGHKRLLKKPASIMSISRDGKYLAQ
ncbi:SEC12-like protein 1, partial [Olea europaea var. sylvestris]|uniref:SEC12-like protein 1 n=1 Tax=Olea europaea var. sylvestris TaxID=158386 RepID=UPI000C1CE2B8